MTDTQAVRRDSDAHDSPAASRGQLLVVEDDRAIGEPLVDGLRLEGFDVTWVRNGRDALAARAVDLVLLDLGLPDLDGREVCRRLRDRSAVPVIVLTARDDEVDRVLLLEMGADDYVVKPFGFRELVARIGAVRRRTAATDPFASDGDVQDIGLVRIDRRARRVWVDGAEVDLAPKEYDLLAYLADAPGVVRRREDIIAEVWDENWWGPTKTLDVHMAALRRKLGPANWISTLRGVGYRFDPPG